MLSADFEGLKRFLGLHKVDFLHESVAVNNSVEKASYEILMENRWANLCMKSLPIQMKSAGRFSAVIVAYMGLLRLTSAGYVVRIVFGIAVFLWYVHIYIAAAGISHTGAVDSV